MKKIVLALVLIMAVDTFAVDVFSSDYEIRRTVIEAIRDKDMTPVVWILKNLESLSVRRQVKVLKAMEEGFNHPASFVRENSEHALLAILKNADYRIPFIVRKGTDGEWKFSVLDNTVKLKAVIPSYTD